MKNKYYTPEIKEFRIGFECEFKNSMQNNVWEKEICNTDTMSICYNAFEHEDYEGEFKDTFRVKYLNEDDIKSLEYENRMKRLPEKYNQYFTKNYKCKRNYYNYIHVLTNDLNNHVLIVASINLDPAKGDTLFTGIIKNKSELKIILKQVT